MRHMSSSMARTADRSAPGIAASGSRKFTQATWELVILRVGPGLPVSSPLWDAFHQPMRRAEEIDRASDSADARIEILLLAAQGQKM